MEKIIEKENGSHLDKQKSISLQDGFISKTLRVTCQLEHFDYMMNSRDEGSLVVIK